MNKTDFCNLLRSRILVLDGAMGTMIQKAELSERDFRGDRFADHSSPLAGCNDLLCITAPDTIKNIHRSYLEAGADIISTDTFNANAISMADYGLDIIPGLVREINRAGAAVARMAADEASPRSWSGRPLVAGSVGPTNKSASISPDISDPACRNITYDRLFEAYSDQIAGLIEGGVDIILFETVFDTLNLKAGLDAAMTAMRNAETSIPVMVSATISNKSGRLLSGQTLRAFCTSIEEYPCIVSIGINCSFGPKDLATPLRELTQSTGHFISTHPNAGLPDALGHYNVSPEVFAEEIKPLLDERLVNIAGGCCGTTPEHIAALRRAADSALPHVPKPLDKILRVSGLEQIEVRPENNFLVVGERCNVAGSRKFLRLIKERNYDEAIRIAGKQVEDGARIIDVNMDDPLLDAAAEMQHFLRLYASDPDVAKAPVMIDSSDWNVVEFALKNLQGKSIVNSISLKEGEDSFIAKARRIRELGAAVIVMAFDEKGQADTFLRKIEICRRAYGLLTEKCGFKGEDIIFDVNVMAVATGLEQHSRYGIDFIKAVEWVKENLPGARTSGGISNLSFAFRGRNALREAMHSVFLYHAISAGLDMAIMNPASSLTYDDIDPELRDLIEDVIFDRNAGASDKLAEYAGSEAAADKSHTISSSVNDISDLPPARRIENALVAGKTDTILDDIDQLLATGMKGVEIVEGPLMEGMKRTGSLFGEGKMFLPQVVKSARVMKQAVDHLKPSILAATDADAVGKAGKVLIATVKGDVHDIGKNIVSIVLACNNFEVIDLGVMVEAESIVETALKEKPDIICLSGLITPSLAEMTKVAEKLCEAGCEMPLMVGGATTSDLHTALKIAPGYRGPVMHMRDASQNPIAASQILNPATKGLYIARLKQHQTDLCEKYIASGVELLPLSEARKKNSRKNGGTYIPKAPESGIGKIIVRDFSIKELMPFINWNMLLHAWGMHPKGCCGDCDRESMRLLDDARRLLSEIDNSGRFDGFGILTIVNAAAEGDDIILDGRRFPMLRQQQPDSGCRSLADFILPEDDYAGVFMAGAGRYIESEYRRMDAEGDCYRSLLLQSLSDRLAEAASEYLHLLARRDYWGYAPMEDSDQDRLMKGHYTGIRPAMGYPMLPDQLLNKEIVEMLQPESGRRVEVTENGAMTPSSTVSGIYIANPDARYLNIGKIGDDQIMEYAYRRGIPVDRIREILNR